MKKGRQSPASKMRRKNFGIAARTAKILRQHFGNTLPFPTDLDMQRNFVGAIVKWFGVKDAASLPPEQALAISITLLNCTPIGENKF